MILRYSFPSLIDDGRIDWALKLLSIIQDGGAKDGICLDWQNVADISPAGHAILCCIFDILVEQHQRITNISIPKRLRAMPSIQALEGVESYSQLPLPEQLNYETGVLLLRGHSTIDLLFQERFQEKFIDILGEDLSYDCRLILSELMQNSVDHSTSERFYIYAGPWQNEFHVGLLDMGSTIPAKLEQKYICEDDLEYLELALKEGVGTRRKRPGGLGLFYFFNTLKMRTGKMTIVSRGAQIRRYFNTRRSQRNMLKHPLRGTWCFARFSRGKP